MHRKLLLAALAIIMVACSSSPKIQGGGLAGPSTAAAVQFEGSLISQAVVQPISQVVSAQAQTVPVAAVAQAALLQDSAPAANPALDGPGVLGPDVFPEGVNPLTGEQVDNPKLLDYSPALISITNFPVSARPQAGLSFSPYVFEMYIGEGMTRFLAMFYGDYPEAGAGNGSNTSDKSQVGPIRSGRLPYESVRVLYNGFLVMASADSSVGAHLNASTNVFGSDATNINSAMVDVTRLQDIAAAQTSAATQNLTGNQFSADAPEGGQPAGSLWVFYSWLNQVKWDYDSTSGAYLRSQDNADGSGKFKPSTDRLNDEPLAFENVVVLFAPHKVLNRAGTLIDISLLYTRGNGYLLRDGQVYPIVWDTTNGEYERTTGRLRPIRFRDQAGNLISLKPGQTWVEVMDTTTGWSDLKGGAWKARFYAPPAPK